VCASTCCLLALFANSGPSQQSALVQKCAVEGKPYADTRSAREGIWHPSNSLTQPSGRHIGTPVETGPFDFVPDRFTRKQ